MLTCLGLSSIAIGSVVSSSLSSQLPTSAASFHSKVTYISVAVQSEPADSSKGEGSGDLFDFSSKDFSALFYQSWCALWYEGPMNTTALLACFSGSFITTVACGF